MAELNDKDDATVPRPRMGWIAVGLLALLAIWGAWQLTPMVRQWLSSPGMTSSIGGPFSLIDQRGQRVTQATLTGKPSVIFFGFTHCPDVCPTALSDMSGWLAAMGPAADKLRMVFVTVDPTRDTPVVLNDYMRAFDPRILALTGTEAEITAMLKAYRVFAKKGEATAGAYRMDHSSAIYLMDANGNLTTVIGGGEKTDVAMAKLKDLAGG